MTFKEQLNKLKDNWLMIVLVLAVLFVFTFSGSGSSMSNFSKSISSNDMMVQSASYARGGTGIYPPTPSGNDFAPNVEERQIVKTTSMGLEVQRGEFKTKEQQLRDIVSSTDSYLLNSNSNKHGEGSKQYYSGYYSIKVDLTKYDAVIAQLKRLGDVTSFSENEQDITGSYTNMQIELEAEKARLDRYQNMYDEATLVADKITLSDKIFNQERTIKYYEDSIKNIDHRVEYSTITLNMNEKRSNYANVAFVKFSELVRKLVDNFSNVFKFVFVIFPWALLALIIWGIVKLFKRKSKPEKA